MRAIALEKISAPLTTLTQSIDKSGKWFEDWDNNAGRDYLKINARTVEGRKSIVKFNSFESK